MIELPKEQNQVSGSGSTPSQSKHEKSGQDQSKHDKRKESLKGKILSCPAGNIMWEEGREMASSLANAVANFKKNIFICIKLLHVLLYQIVYFR